MVGIDPKGAQYTWDAVPNNFWPDDALSMTRGLVGLPLSSAGVARSESVRPIG